MNQQIQQVLDYFKKKIMFGEYLITNAKRQNMVSFLIDDKYSFTYFYSSDSFQTLISGDNFINLPEFSKDETIIILNKLNSKISLILNQIKEGKIKDLENEILNLKKQ